MISVPIVNVSGKEVGTYSFNPAELADGINKQLLHDVVVMYEANLRVGTMRTKSRAEVAGNKKKMFKQKGTGRARAGNRRTPVRRGGGHAFAKRPRDFSYRLPKKAIRAATRMALLSKFQDGEAVVLDALPVDAPKTRTVAAMLKAIGLAGKPCLLTVRDHNENIWKSSRNIAGLSVSPSRELNAYSMLRSRHLVVTKDALDALRTPDGDAA
jgi:large subunit ribosomal protein L4